MIERAFVRLMARTGGCVLVLFCFFGMRDNMLGVGGSVSTVSILGDGAMKGNKVIFNLLHGYPPLSSSGLLAYRLSS